MGLMSELVEKWTPLDCSSEKEYEDSFYNFLLENIPDFTITRQYALGRTKADIVVEDGFIIELKHNLTGTNEYHRVIGQITEYKKWGWPLLVVLTGTTDPDLQKRLERHLDSEWPSIDPDDAKVVIKKI